MPMRYVDAHRMRRLEDQWEYGGIDIPISKSEVPGFSAFKSSIPPSRGTSLSSSTASQLQNSTNALPSASQPFPLLSPLLQPLPSPQLKFHDNVETYESDGSEFLEIAELMAKIKPSSKPALKSSTEQKYSTGPSLSQTLVKSLAAPILSSSKNSSQLFSSSKFKVEKETTPSLAASSSSKSTFINPKAKAKI